MLRAVATMALLPAVTPAFAQEVPGGSGVGPAPADQADDSGGSASDQTAPATTPQLDPQAVIAQWGPAPEMGPEADQAVARRWLRDQQAYRDRWGIPGVRRDLYLDWVASNALHDFLNEPLDPSPAGLTKSQAAQQSPQSDTAVRDDQWYWSVSDDLWQAWLDSFQNKVPIGWTALHPDEPWFTRERYLRLEEWRRQRFDRFRLFGVAGRVDASKSPALLTLFDQQTLEQLAPGSAAAYQPVNYASSLVAIVAYDPWINPDGTLRP